MILSVDGRSTQQWEDSLILYTSAGNPAVLKRTIASYMLRGDSGSLAQIVYKDSLDIVHSLSCYRNYPYGPWFSDYTPSDSLGTIKWKKWNCNVGYVNMGKLLISDVDTMYAALKNTTAIIFDLRNYPNGTAWPIASLIYTDYTCFAKFAKPVITYPGTCFWENDFLGWNGNPEYYTGKVIILCNQETQSQAEFSCMILKAMSNSVVVGSQTAGTDGNVTSFNLTRDIQTGFTSMGVYYPNGDSTERIGIVPDSVVYPTLEGTRQGRDEVLEKALQVANCLVPVLSVSPQNQNVAAPAGSVSFSITSNTNWSAICDTSWCTITASGSGNGTIIGNYTENTSYQPRVANIRVTVAGLPEKMVTLTQAKSTIGIEEHPEDFIQVYPNPTNGFFRIASSHSNESALDVSIHDINGKIILKKQCKGEKEYGINLLSVPQGIYQIIIKTDNNLSVHKLVIIK
jgi:Secretion system C-terminal sorting domain/Peptidase family S41/Viral BACON domain